MHEGVEDPPLSVGPREDVLQDVVHLSWAGYVPKNSEEFANDDGDDPEKLRSRVEKAASLRIGCGEALAWRSCHDDPVVCR